MNGKELGGLSCMSLLARYVAMHMPVEAMHGSMSRRTLMLSVKNSLQYPRWITAGKTLAVLPRHARVASAQLANNDSRLRKIRAV